MERDAVIRPQRSRIHRQPLLQARFEGEREGRMHPSAQRAVETNAPIADLVPEALDHNCAEEVLDRAVVEAGALAQPACRSLRLQPAQLADHLAEGEAELSRPAGRVCLPERDLARLPGCRRHQHLRRRYLRYAPGRSAEHERLADPALVHHLFVQLTDAAPVFDEVHAVEAAIGDRARVGHGQPLRTGTPTHGSGHAVPHDAGAQLGELIRWIPAAEHVEHRLERAWTELAVRIRAADDGRQLVDLPLVHRAHRDDLLRQHVERLARNHRGFDSPLQHPLDHCRGLEQVAPELGDHDSARHLAHRVARAPDSLDARCDAGRRLDLEHQIDSSHVDAELEGRGGDEPTQGAGFQLILDEQPLLTGDRTVMGPDQVFAGQLVDARSEALGEAPRVDEHDRRVVRLDELEQARVDGRPDAVLHCAAVVLRGQARHVVHRHLDGDLHRLQPSGVDDRDLPGPSKESRDLLQWALRGRKSDPLWLGPGERA